MNDIHLLSNSTMPSHQITQLMNIDILILNLTSVHQCIIDDADESYEEFLMIDDQC